MGAGGWIVASLLLLFIGRAMARGKRQAWFLTVALFTFSLWCSWVIGRATGDSGGWYSPIASRSTGRAVCRICCYRCAASWTYGRLALFGGCSTIGTKAASRCQ